MHSNQIKIVWEEEWEEEEEETVCRSIKKIKLV